MKKYFVKKSLICLSLMALLPNAHADLMMSHYKTLKNSSESEKLNIYVKGISEGIIYSHVQALLQKKPTTFCPPKDFVLSPENAMIILDEELKFLESKQKSLEAPVGNAIMVNLATMYPCKVKK